MTTIAQAVGKLIKCPDCGAPSLVTPGPPPPLPSTQPSTLGWRTHRRWDGSEVLEVVEVPTLAPGSSAAAWYEVSCPRTGRKLYSDLTRVELITEENLHHVGTC